ncbi:MAG TPA: response regulator, partial [Myxococcota bacterium]|nr:response regulator [Myxococcota bacterium]
MAKARILAVDDQLYFRSFIEDLLSQEGYEVVTASTGEEALERVERERFDVVVTDLVMPGMDGCVLVQRLKERVPDQEIVVVTGVGDVKTAVEAMKLGATDYQLKPIDRISLSRSLEGLLQRRRLREEHARLMAENLEYMGVLSLFERAMGLFSTLALEPLCERIVEGLCLETRAQGGVLWVSRDDESGRLRLGAVRGLVRVDEEPEELALEGQLTELPALEGGAALAPTRGRAGGIALYVPLRQAARTLAVVRLTDRLDGREFGDRDRAAAQKFGEFAAQAVANAQRFRALERRSFRDPATRAYTQAFFDDVARNEIQKANRFGRSFAVLKLVVDAGGPLDRGASESELARRLEAVVNQIGRSLRSTDLLAVEGEGRFCVLLPETDALGAAVLKRRIRDSLENGDVLAPLAAGSRVRALTAAASFPADGTQLEALSSVLDARIDEERRSLVHTLELESQSFPDSVKALLDRKVPVPPELPEQVMRFLLDEVSRRPRERGLLFLAPGSALSSSLRDGFERLRGLQPRTEVVLVADGMGESLSGAPLTCVSPRRAGTRASFVVYYGEGPAYAMVSEGAGDRGK